MGLYPSDIEGMAVVHGENMERAGKCRARHDALIEILNKHEAKYGEGV